MKILPVAFFCLVSSRTVVAAPDDLHAAKCPILPVNSIDTVITHLSGDAATQLYEQLWKNLPAHYRDQVPLTEPCVVVSGEFVSCSRLLIGPKKDFECDISVSLKDDLRISLPGMVGVGN